MSDILPAGAENKTVTATKPASHSDTRLGRAAMWVPCGSMLLLSFISYADRSVLSILSPTILHALHLSQEQYGRALSAFMVCYMVANPAWGLLMDRAGLFVATLAAVAVWSAASGLHAMVGGFLGLCVARAVLGFGEGATFPAGLKTVVETLPKEKRAFGLGIAYSGGSLGAALAPLVVVPLALRFGWRAAFVWTAALGLAWMMLWVVMRRMGFYRRTAVVEQPSAWSTSLAKPKIKTNWAAAWRMAGAAFAYGLGALPLAFGLYFAALYLADVLHLTQSAVGKLLWVPPLGWEAGYLVWGKVMDRRARLGLGRPLGMMVLLTLASLLLCTLPMLASLPHPVLLTMMMFFASMFISAGFVVAALADGMAGEHQTTPGLMAGLCISAWSMATAVAMPLVGRMFDHGEYALSIRYVAMVPIAGTILWWLCSRAERRVTADAV